MAHRLFPKPGQPYLSPSEVVRSLRDEFTCVDADQDAGADHLGNMIVQLLRMRAPQVIIEAHRRAQEQAVRVVVVNEPAGEVYLDFVAMPDQGLFIGYSSAQHEVSTQELLRRCSEALGYEIELV